MNQLTTPDGRYIIVRDRLWRRADPTLLEETRVQLVHELMAARRAKKAASQTQDRVRIEAAKSRVQAAKEKLGERGPVWWHDGAPDENRKLVKNSSYAGWYAAVTDVSDAEGEQGI